MPNDLVNKEEVVTVNSKTVYFGPLTETAIIPKYAKNGDAGMDIYSDEIAFLHPGETKTVRSGVRIKLPVGTVGLVCPRSGMASKNCVTVGNAPGVVDCFSENSDLSTPSGEKKIKDIRIGEAILSVNENGEIEVDEISAIYDKGFQEIICFETENGVLEVTPNSYVYTSSGLKMAKDITIEDFLISLL